MKYSVSKLAKKIWIRMHRSHYKSSKLEAPLPKKLSNPSVIESLEVLAIEESLKLEQCREREEQEEKQEQSQQQEQHKNPIEEIRIETPVSHPIKETLIDQACNNKDAGSLISQGRVKTLISELVKQTRSTTIPDRSTSTPPLPSLSHYSSSNQHAKSTDQFKGLVKERRDQLFKQTARYKMLMEYGISGDHLVNDDSRDN